MDIERFWEDCVSPVLFFLFVLYICIWHLKNALPVYRQFKREGATADAAVTGFKATKYGIKNSDMFFVEVSAVPPGESAEKHYKLSTCHGRGKRYGSVSQCRICFISKDDPEPVLEEEIKLWHRDIIISFVGIALSVLMISLFLFAGIDRLM